MLFSTICAACFLVLCLFEFTTNALCIYATCRGKLWRQSTAYILGLGNLINDQFLLITHIAYLIPAIYTQTVLSKDVWGIYPQIAFYMLLYGWYVCSFTLAFIAITRFLVICTNIPPLSKMVASCCVVLIYFWSAAMAYVAQFVFPCCQMTMNPFWYSYSYTEIEGLNNDSNMYFDFPLNNAVSVISAFCYTIIIIKLVVMRRSSMVGRNKTISKEFGYALQFCLVSVFYVLNWISTRVNGYIFGSTIELYSFGAFALIFNCGANGIIYLFRNKEIRANLPFFSNSSRGGPISVMPTTTLTERNNSLKN